MSGKSSLALETESSTTMSRLSLRVLPWTRSLKARAIDARAECMTVESRPIALILWLFRAMINKRRMQHNALSYIPRDQRKNGHRVTKHRITAVAMHRDSSCAHPRPLPVVLSARAMVYSQLSFTACLGRMYGGITIVAMSLLPLQRETQCVTLRRRITKRPVQH